MVKGETAKLRAKLSFFNLISKNTRLAVTRVFAIVVIAAILEQGTQTNIHEKTGQIFNYYIVKDEVQAL